MVGSERKKNKCYWKGQCVWSWKKQPHGREDWGRAVIHAGFAEEFCVCVLGESGTVYAERG